MSQIFISYARIDQGKAKRLVQCLEQEGWRVWWDQGLIPGDVWDERIQKAVDEAECVIALWSSESVKSKWVRAEASEAFRRKILIPVMLDQVRLPLPFSLIHSAKLIGWDGNLNEARLKSIMLAVKHVVEKTTSRTGLSESGIVGMPGQLKTKLSTLLILLLPALLAGFAMWCAMNWHLPTKVDLSIWTSHVDMTIRASKEKYGLLNPIPIAFVQLEHFSAVTTVMDRIERLDPTKGADPLTASVEQSWIPLPHLTGPVSFQQAHPNAVPVVQVQFFKPSTPLNNKGRLEAVETHGLTELSLNIRGPNANLLTIDAWSEKMMAQLTVPSEFLVDLREIALQSRESVKDQIAVDPGSYRILVTATNERLQIAGEAAERIIDGTVYAGQRLVMALELDPEFSAPTFEQDVLRLQSVRFLEGHERLDKVLMPDIFEGTVILPQHKDRKQVPITKSEFLILKDLHDDFHMKSIARDPQKKALRIQLGGTVGGIQVGNTIDNQDLRLTVYERLKGDPMIAVVAGVILVAFPMTVGAWRLWKELAA